MELYLDALKRYVEFSGRSSRKAFWYFVGLNLVVVIVLAIIEAIIGIPGMLSGLYQLGVLLPSLAVGVRRLHDTGRSGWWTLIAFIPFGGLVLLYFYVLEGNTSPNQYGPSPY
ncbi:MAG: DUF805 domain-containing protein [Chloroflexi bacterium]|nr:DUF805 domain-containing protein [Chloroflexota bacterium]